VLALLLPVLLAVEVERVLAVVNGVPILASDAELAEASQLIPRQPGEGDVAYRAAVVEALIELELRWQDLEAAALTSRVQVDLDAAWAATVKRAGGADALRDRLAALGLPEAALRTLVRRAAVVEAYVATRFAPFVRSSAAEVEKAWSEELAPQLRAAGKSVPDFAAVRDQVEALLRERKLGDEVERWTAELTKRAEIVRYLRAPQASAAAASPTPLATLPAQSPRPLP
jgi:hypothetical protein